MATSNNGGGYQQFTLEEAKEKLNQAIDLTKLFPGFRTPPWVFTGLGKAVEAVCLGNNGRAVAKILETERSIYNVLASFFRNSATKFFPNKLGVMEEDGVDQNILQRVQKKVWELQDYAGRVENLDLMAASKLYNETLETFRWARGEYARRLNKRGWGEEEQEAVAQKMFEQERRQKIAAGLEELVNRLRARAE